MTMDHGQCLTEETLTEYLDGALDPAMKAASEVHLVACDDCRRRLALFMRMLDEEVLSEEEHAIQVFEGQWHKQKPSSKPSSETHSKRWLVALASVAAGLLIALVTIPMAFDPFHEPRSGGAVVDLLLAQQRPFEARMSNQPHLPAVRTRGKDVPGVAFDLLTPEMIRLGADTHQMGRFYLLQKDFTRAMGYLEMAEQEVRQRAEVHNDLGVAYLESGGEGRLQEAAEEFRHALRLNDAFGAAVFNMAVLNERTGDSAQAQLYWQRFVQLEPDSAWGAEARSRLEASRR